MRNGRYDNLPLEVVTSTKKLVNVRRYYNMERLRPNYARMEMTPLFMITSDE